MSTNGVDPLYELRPEERKRIDEIKENKDWVDEEAAQRAAQREQMEMSSPRRRGKERTPDGPSPTRCCR